MSQILLLPAPNLTLTLITQLEIALIILQVVVLKTHLLPEHQLILSKITAHKYEGSKPATIGMD